MSTMHVSVYATNRWTVALEESYGCRVQTLSFMPDVSCVPPLWYADGEDVGAAWYEPELLSAELMADLKAWIEEWSSFHNCEVRDDTHVEWTTRGRDLCERTRVELLPHGLSVIPDFEGSICGDQGRYPT
jgi:hypothetical protein